MQLFLYRKIPAGTANTDGERVTTLPKGLTVSFYHRSPYPSYIRRLILWNIHSLTERKTAACV